MRNQPHGQGTITGYSEDLTDIIGRMLMVAPRSRPSAEEVDDACTYSRQGCDSSGNDLICKA